LVGPVAQCLALPIQATPANKAALDGFKHFGECADELAVVRSLWTIHNDHSGGGGEWDAHSENKSNHTKLAAPVDQPIAGLLTDLKQRSVFTKKER
jgi:hypothetical protein